MKEVKVEWVFQKGIIKVDLPDHQLVFCARKISKFAIGGVQKYINFRSLINYRVDNYKKIIGQLFFPNYKIFDNAKAAYSDFVPKKKIVIDKTATILDQAWQNYMHLHKCLPRNISFFIFRISFDWYT